ncbi:MAG TPA: hypothetical protein VN908_12605 [Gemmatimonadales bacterium]|nr:hypothetical protein [Gemmatimonadales bacterium]
MKRMLAILGLLIGLGAASAAAQTRVGISLSFGDPYIGGHIVIGRPYYHSYSHPYYYRYEPYYPPVTRAPRFYRPSRVIVVRPHRYHPHRHHRW